MKAKRTNQVAPHRWEVDSCICWLTSLRSAASRRWYWGAALAFYCLCKLEHNAGASEPAANSFEKSNFSIRFDEHGVTGLANPKDPFGAQMLAAGQRLGIVVRFRAGDTNWLELSSAAMQLAKASQDDAELVYTNDTPGGPLRLRETFTFEGAALDWQLELANATNVPVEVGDLAIQVPVPGPRGEQPKEIFEHGFLRHQFISGDGSFLYFVRASGVPPFLLVTVRPGTRLEYFTGSGGRGGGPVFVHSGLSGGRETRGSWRRAHTFLELGTSGEQSRVRYGFRFHWANSYDEMRALLYQEGLFDIRAVPGMVVPTDLKARFALHTRARLDSIQPEFADQTEITSLGETQPGCHLYEVAFQRLGENLLTIHHDGGRKTYLEYFVTEPLETLIKKRAAFIIGRQQIRDASKWWDGVFGPYDMKHEVVRTIDDPDIFTGRMVYVLTCDDPGLCKAPFVAEKNVSFPDRQQIEGLEYYLQHFVWGHLQRTDSEQPYPYGVYGTPNWYADRDPARRKAAAGSNPTAVRDLSKEHIWRSYDYPHLVMLYFHMYEIAKKYPSLSKYLDAAGYLERAYQTAHAFFTYPYEIYPSYYETYKWGLYNELVVLKLADALDREGFFDRSAWLRSEWEKKVKYFVYDDPYPFRSEYAFDRTAFESSYALAKYGATHDMKPDTNLWYDVKLRKWYSHPSVKREDSRAFMERQLAAGLCVRGWLEPSYYQLGADGGLSYMAAMGGWGILDYTLNFASNPFDWLQLGYASYLSSWCLVNAGPASSHYGFWFPGKENDGAAGWQFMSAKFGHAWMGADVARGPWPYDGEIDLGFGGALRMAATVLADDPLFGWVAYGGALSETNGSFTIIPRDGLRQRFDAVAGGKKGSAAKIQRVKIQLDRDGFAPEQTILVDKSFHRIFFTLENRTADRHTTGLWLSLPDGTACTVQLNGTPVSLQPTGNWDYPRRAELDLTTNPASVQITAAPPP